MAGRTHATVITPVVAAENASSELVRRSGGLQPAIPPAIPRQYINLMKIT
jgi:hypothetical protein